MIDETGFLRLPDTPAGAARDPEMALLLSCCRTMPRPADVERQRSLATQVDCGRLLALAERHMVSPMVWNSLRRHGSGCFDAGLIDALFATSRRNALAEMAWIHVACGLHRRFMAHGIDHCLLKGLAVAERYYALPGLRAVGDIDLVVPGAAVDAATRLLAESGFVAGEPIDSLTARQRRYFMFQQNQVAFDDPGSGIGVELHWRPDQVPQTLRALDLFSGSSTVTVGDCRIPCLDHEDMLLHLCVHGGKHAWFRLKWIFDLPNVLESREWDWASLGRKARENRCEHALLLGLAVAERFCGWIPPATVSKWLDESNGFSPHLALVERALASHERWLNSPAGIVRRYRYAARFNDGPDTWLYLIATFATHRRDWEALPLPDALFPIYFLISPFTNLFHLATRLREARQPRQDGHPADGSHIR